MQSKAHWDHIYATRTPDRVSLYQVHADQSVRLIEATGVSKSASILDVGAGASNLVDDLLDLGYTDLTVLDLSSTALCAARKRLGARSTAVKWLAADVTEAPLPPHSFDVWHDRAVFHFFTAPKDRQAYVAAVLRAVKPGGHVVVATFAEDGPAWCSGLPVMRYSARQLHGEFGALFTLVRHEREEHHTPTGAVQKFVYCYCRTHSF